MAKFSRFVPGSGAARTALRDEAGERPARDRSSQRCQGRSPRRGECRCRRSRTRRRRRGRRAQARRAQPTWPPRPRWSRSRGPWPARGPPGRRAPARRRGRRHARDQAARGDHRRGCAARRAGPAAGARPSRPAAELAPRAPSVAADPSARSAHHAPMAANRSASPASVSRATRRSISCVAPSQSLVTGDEAVRASVVRAKARELLGRDSESLSDRNFPRILKDAHDNDVIDLRRRGDDFEVARATDAESVADQLAKTAIANAPAQIAAPPAPRGMGARGVSGPRGRGGRPGAPPADLLEHRRGAFRRDARTTTRRDGSRRRCGAIGGRYTGGRSRAACREGRPSLAPSAPRRRRPE